mmetsp:Transcript_46187/g.109810  ORF Transcript_46187/g.109810 Transcript_46187/m.109810 type:complete len:240 (-) Transcript_46187:82-801(-)
MIGKSLDDNGQVVVALPLASPLVLLTCWPDSEANAHKEGLVKRTSGVHPLLSLKAHKCRTLGQAVLGARYADTGDFSTTREVSPEAGFVSGGRESLDNDFQVVAFTLAFPPPAFAILPLAATSLALTCVPVVPSARIPPIAAILPSSGPIILIVRHGSHRSGWQRTSSNLWGNNPWLLRHALHQTLWRCDGWRLWPTRNLQLRTHHATRWWCNHWLWCGEPRFRGQERLWDDQRFRSTP